MPDRTAGRPTDDTVSTAQVQLRQMAKAEVWSIVEEGYGCAGCIEYGQRAVRALGTSPSLANVTRRFCEREEVCVRWVYPPADESETRPDPSLVRLRGTAVGEVVGEPFTARQIVRHLTQPNRESVSSP